MIIEQLLLYKTLKTMDDLGNEILGTIRDAIAQDAYYVTIQVSVGGKCYMCSYEYVPLEALKDVVYKLGDYDGITFEITIKSYKR